MTYSSLWHVCRSVFNLSVTPVLHSLVLGLCIIHQNSSFCPLHMRHMYVLVKLLMWYLYAPAPLLAISLHFAWPWLIKTVGIQPCWISSELLGEGWFSCFRSKEAYTTSRMLSSSRIPVYLTAAPMLFASSREKYVLGHGSHPTSVNVEACRFPLHTALWPRLQEELEFTVAHVACHKELQTSILPGGRTGMYHFWAARDPWWQ